nr:hypothetical protein CFP56_72680 [Quercus suber]
MLWVNPFISLVSDDLAAELSTYHRRDEGNDLRRDFAVNLNRFAKLEQTYEVLDMCFQGYESWVQVQRCEEAFRETHLLPLGQSLRHSSTPLISGGWGQGAQRSMRRVQPFVHSSTPLISGWWGQGAQRSMRRVQPFGSSTS